MARQPRFLLANRPHLIEQRGHNGAAIAHDDEDRRRWLALLRDAAAAHRVVLHAWGLGRDRFRLLATPPSAAALSRMMQTLGRRYVGAFNARHGRSGTLFDGRFQVCLVEDGEWTLASMQHVEALPAADGGLSSLPHHLGDHVDPALSDPPAYWALGNTPFDRHLAWRHRLEAGVTDAEREVIARALRSGRPLGSARFVEELQRDSGARLVPRPRGRPALRRS